MYDSNKAHYVSATVIVVKDGKFLITKRALNEKAFPGKWTVPGGKLEMSDYNKRPKDTAECWYNVLEDAAKREILEEVGLSANNIKYLTSLVYMRDDGIPTIVISLFSEYEGGEIKLCSALTDYDWVTLEEAKKYDLIGGIFEELEMLDKFLKEGKFDEWKKA